MKIYLLLGVAYLFCGKTYAQNQNVTNVSKTTTTTITDENGTKVLVKEKETNEIQNIELKKEKANTLNIEAKDTPIISNSTTTISDNLGNSNRVAKDFSGNYIFNEKKYKLFLDTKGYYLQSNGNKMVLLSKTGSNVYLYHTKEFAAIAYFSEQDELIIEKHYLFSNLTKKEKYILLK